MNSHRGSDEVLIESRALTAGQAIVTMSDPRLRNFCWAPDGRILYARLENLKEASANIWEVGIDPSTWRTSGEPRRLTNWAGFTLLDLSATADGKRDFLCQKNGSKRCLPGPFGRKRIAVEFTPPPHPR